jgi:hypothetical protein
MQGDDNDRNERKRKNKNRKRVDLNVGGETFSTSLATLTSHPKSLFAEIFSGSFEEDLDSDGSYFIDRDPVVFLHVLNYLREQLIPVDTLSVRERDALLADAEYYQLPLLAGLVMEKQKEMAVERRDNKKEKKPRKASNSDGDVRLCCYITVFCNLILQRRKKTTKRLTLSNRTRRNRA